MGQFLLAPQHSARLASTGHPNPGRVLHQARIKAKRPPRWPTNPGWSDIGHRDHTHTHTLCDTLTDLLSCCTLRLCAPPLMSCPAPASVATTDSSLDPPSLHQSECPCTYSKWGGG